MVMEFYDVIKARRSTRKFTNDKVSSEQILRMLDAAISAPNACNMQSWHFYVVTDPAVKKRMADEGVMAAWAATAPVIFVVCTAAAEITSRFGERGEKLFAIQDTAAAIENLLLCAADMGLGGCFMGAFDHDKCSSILGILDGHHPVAMVPVGRPAQILPARPRNPLESAVTFIGDPDNAEYTAQNTQFRGYEVKNSKLPNAVFENLSLQAAKFHKINMPSALFDDINLSGTKFNNVNLSGTEFSDINMEKCSYGGMTMKHSSFGCVELNESVFQNTVFDGASFKNCSFKNVSLENCDLEGMSSDGKEVK